jgi:hypothetical protein
VARVPFCLEVDPGLVYQFVNLDVHPERAMPGNVINREPATVFFLLFFPSKAKHLNIGTDLPLPSRGHLLPPKGNKNEIRF